MSLPMRSAPKLEHALDAVSRGLPVFPQDGKRPSIRRWPDNATLKESVIARWWKRWPDADIGIALPADIYVLDADSGLAVLALAGLSLPPTLTVSTARGQHRYFHVPHELARKTPLPAATGFACVEGKGRPGPVTWAGSVHSTGHVYAVLVDAPIAWMPGELVRAIGPRRERTDAGAATAAERSEWDTARTRTQVSANHVLAFDIEADARADLRLTLNALRLDLPHMPTSWADRAFRAAAYLGPHVASGGLGLDETVQELTDLFRELDEQGGDLSHVVRSIERGMAVGARSVRL